MQAAQLKVHAAIVQIVNAALASKEVTAADVMATLEMIKLDLFVNI